MQTHYWLSRIWPHAASILILLPSASIADEHCYPGPPRHCAEVTVGSANEARPSDATWSPSFGPWPSRPDPIGPLDTAMQRETQKLEQSIRKLSSQREAWRVALEKLQSDQNWRDELRYFTEDSQVAQLGALKASLSLLIGIAGPMNEAITIHSENAALLWNRARRLRGRLDELGGIISAGRNTYSADALLASKQLDQTYRTVVTAMKSEDSLTDLFRHLDRIGEGVLRATKYTELSHDMLEKHSLMLAITALKDFVIRDVAADLAKKYAEAELSRMGASGTARGLKLAEFFIDYGYQSARFYVSWTNVNSILTDIDDRAWFASKIQRQITEKTDQLKVLRIDREKLRDASNREEKETVLLALRQRQLREARLAGEWFSQSTGIRASGAPINNN